MLRGRLSVLDPAVVDPAIHAAVQGVVVATQSRDLAVLERLAEMIGHTRMRPGDRLPPERMAEVLKAWHASQLQAPNEPPKADDAGKKKEPAKKADDKEKDPVKAFAEMNTQWEDLQARALVIRKEFPDADADKKAELPKSMTASARSYARAKPTRQSRI